MRDPQGLTDRLEHVTVHTNSSIGVNLSPRETSEQLELYVVVCISLGAPTFQPDSRVLKIACLALSQPAVPPCSSHGEPFEIIDRLDVHPGSLPRTPRALTLSATEALVREVDLLREGRNH